MYTVYLTLINGPTTATTVSGASVMAVRAKVLTANPSAAYIKVVAFTPVTALSNAALARRLLRAS